MRTQSSSAAYHHPNLDAVVKLYKAGAKVLYPQFTKQRTTTNDRDRIGTEGVFGVLSAVSEGGSFPQIDYRTPFTMDITPIKYGGIFSVSSEAKESDKHGIIAKRTTKLLRAADLTVDYLCADIHNLATSTSMPTPDGQAFASASHLYNGGTFSNIVTSTPALSISALETALQELMSAQKDDEGNPIMFMGPYTLLVPPALAGLANRLVSSLKFPTTNNNDPNWAGELISKVVVNPLFTSSTAWSLISQGQDCPFVLLERRGVQVDMDEDFDKDGDKVRVNRIFARYAESPLGWIYSGT